MADLAEWVRQDITAQLLHWLTLNTQDNLYGPSGGGSQPPLLCVFYRVRWCAEAGILPSLPDRGPPQRYSELDPLWHLRGFGNPRAAARFSLCVARAWRPSTEWLTHGVAQVLCARQRQADPLDGTAQTVAARGWGRGAMGVVLSAVR